MNLLVRLTTAALFCLAASASAEIIGVEQFDYPDSVIATKSGGTFWDYKNFTPIGHNGTASTWDNFSGAPVVTSGRLVTSNSSAKREYNGALESDGAVNDPASVPSSVAKTVYYRVTFTTGATLPSFLSISSSDFGTDIVSFGVSLNVANDNKFAIRIHPLSFTLSNNPTLIVANTTYTLVLKLDYTNNLASLYLNPDLNAAEGAVTPLLAATNFTPTNWSTSLRLASGTGGSVTWDDLVAATTWDELGTVVTTTTDEDGSLNPATGTGVSLREAVKYSPAGSLITFDPALNGKTCTVSLGEMVIDKPLAIDGSALANGVTIDANRTSRHFFINGNTASLTLKALTLINGNGGGDGGNVGGAIHLFTGNLSLQRCTLSGNFAGSAGAIWLQGSGTSRLEECTITGNRATVSVGTGGIAIPQGTCTLSRCTISGNTGSGNGGGLFLQSPASVSLNNCLIAGNTDSLANDISKASGTLTPIGNNLIGSFCNFFFNNFWSICSFFGSYSSS